MLIYRIIIDKRLFFIYISDQKIKYNLKLQIAKFSILQLYIYYLTGPLFDFVFDLLTYNFLFE